MRAARSEEYLSRQLIAYIGNKRRLLPKIQEAFSRLVPSLRSGESPRFLDPFCGSGAVARLARAMGMAVAASDAEPYAALLASAFLCHGTEAVERAFRPFGGIEAALERLNSLHPLRGAPPCGGEGLLAGFYAPADTQNADWKRERMFYTRENALFLDRVRAQIDLMCPEGAEDATARDILLGLLLYEASVHANTSGVFKAFHKGYGGHGKDALGRIMGPAELEYPAIIDGPPAQAACMDALEALGKGSADVVYLDPPYNQHQYGSNYHLLNAILLNDQGRAPALDTDASGRLREKAGIDPSWKERRSPWCSRGSAPSALRRLVDAIDAPCIVMSYGDSGMIEGEELMDILSERGRVDLQAWPYTAYRGGRQSDSRIMASCEFLFIVRTEEAARQRKAAGSMAESLARARLEACSGRVLSKDAKTRVLDGRLTLRGGVNLPCRWPFLNSVEINDLPMGMTWVDLESDLGGCLARSMEEEADVCLSALAEENELRQRNLLSARLLLALRKLAHPRYMEAFERLLPAARGGLGGHSLSMLDGLEAQARRRMEEAPLRGSGRKGRGIGG